MSVRIGQHELGPKHPTFIVAELSGNHNGDLERAVAIVHAAADAGANAIKLQTYTADTITIRSKRPDFVVSGTGPWSGRTLYDLYDEAHTPWEWHERLFAEARGRGLEVFSTPFDLSAVVFLESLSAPAHKVASFELLDDDLLRAVARTGKPLVVSTGMASLAEITRAVEVARAAGAHEIVLLRCTSSYPAPDASMNLASLPSLAEITGCIVGLSDHSLGTVAPVVAVTLGARMIEKHLTLKRSDGGVDSHFSLEPAEFRSLVEDVRRAEAMIGEVRYGPGAAEAQSMPFRRSLYVVEDIRRGEPFTRDNLRSIRPGFGLAPQHLDVFIGRRAAIDIERGTPLTWEHLSGN